MCRRKLFTTIRFASSVILVATFTSFVTINIFQTFSQFSQSTKSWNVTDVFEKSYHPVYSPSSELIYSGKRDFVKLSHLPKEQRLYCPGGEIRSGYCVIRNYFLAEMTAGYNESVTLTTQGTVKFLKHTEELCKRWKGPISVAVYAPGSEFQLSVEEILRLRNCGDVCIRKWITWHFVFDSAHQPPPEFLSVSTKNGLSVSCSTSDSLSKASYIKKHKLAYPINVARNVARLTARTYYVFASDIELYPSQNLLSRFLRMIEKLKTNSNAQINLSNGRHVFVLRVFEVSQNVKSVPKTKEELVALYRKNLAISFHRYMCFTCHRIPGLHEWLRTETPDDQLTTTLTVKRQKRENLSDWEPFFIGTNAEPLFDERLTWNGKANKMQVAFELCLMNYDLHILDDAFLVHVPGIKRFSYKDQQPRVPYMRKNKANFAIITKELYAKYGNNSDC